jgi:hypothetical protein
MNLLVASGQFVLNRHPGPAKMIMRPALDGY